MSRPLLRAGSHGDDVRDLQRMLTAAGYDGGAADGSFGGTTDAAVRSFQSARGLAVDGQVGAQTWAALEESVPVPSRSPVLPPTPGSASGVDWTTLSGDERMAYAMGLLVSTYGYPPAGAAGLVGNLWAESGMLPNRVEGSSAATPMRARGFTGDERDFTPDEVMNRNRSAGVGPRLPGVGLAQWTSSGRRAGLFAHAFGGQVLGEAVLFDTDAQVDYLDHELATSYARVHRLVSDPSVSVDDACDEVVYSFETPGSVIGDGSRLPRGDERVQAVFRQRRVFAARALRAHEAATDSAEVNPGDGADRGGGPVVPDDPGAPRAGDRNHWEEETTMSRALLRTGSRGDDVRDLQHKLSDAGYDPGPADGIFGAKTGAAVRAFQAARGLSVDGLVGPQTWAALDAAAPGRAIDVLWPDVPLLPQTTDTNCWAAAAGMVASWDRESSFDYTQAPAPAGIEDAGAWFDLEIEPPMSITPSALHDLLVAHGPLWICANQPFVAGPGFHAVVVTGMFGVLDPTGVGLCLYTLDPWDRGHGLPCAPAPHTGTHVRGSRYSISHAQHLVELEVAVEVNPGWEWVRIMHARGTRGRRPSTGAATAPIE